MDPSSPAATQVAVAAILRQCVLVTQDGLSNCISITDFFDFLPLGIWYMV